MILYFSETFLLAMANANGFVATSGLKCIGVGWILIETTDALYLEAGNS